LDRGGVSLPLVGGVLDLLSAVGYAVCRQDDFGPCLRLCISVDHRRILFLRVCSTLYPCMSSGYPHFLAFLIRGEYLSLHETFRQNAFLRFSRSDGMRG
jgi:hypothetical protein